MLKAIESQLVISSISSKADGSLGLRVSTPECSSEEKIAFMNLQGKALKGVFSPIDEEESGIEVVQKDLEQKTPSQRLRGVLYVLWKQDPRGKTWEVFYIDYMEKLLDLLKAKIEQ